MEENQMGVVEPSWTSRQRKILACVLVILCLVVAFFFTNKFSSVKSHYTPVPVYATVGLEASSDFQFTISPDNHWLVYLEEVYPYYDRHNIVAYDLSQDKKHVITVDENTSHLLRFGLQNNCWTSDSRYCVLENEINGFVDFSGTEPKFSLGTIEHSDLTCSDCGESNIRKDFDINSHGIELTSPDGKIVAQAISHGSSIVSPPQLYITDTQKVGKIFIASNVYYDMHFTSDSQKLYYYGCKYGGGCDQYTDHLFYVSFSKTGNSMSREGVLTEQPQAIHTDEERARDLDIINKKMVNDREVTLKEHYRLFSETFKKPQKIIGLQSNRLVTKDHYQLALQWGTVLPNDKDVALSNLVESLIGQEVTVVMPPYEEFANLYEGADKYNTDVLGTSLFIHDGQGKEIATVPAPVDPLYNKYIGVIKADVYYKGELLNDRFR